MLDTGLGALKKTEKLIVFFPMGEMSDLRRVC
jgi:hypothetical protein